MAGEGLFEATSIPGHLAPTAERLERLLAKQSLEELYEVEDQPFASHLTNSLVSKYHIEGNHLLPHEIMCKIAWPDMKARNMERRGTPTFDASSCRTGARPPPPPPPSPF
ncbi:hypothetical protein TKK_0006722 [Trichogramma kaykai]